MEVASAISSEKAASEFSYCLIELPCALLSSSLEEERKGGEDGGRTSAVWESVWREISHHDEPIMIYRSS